MSGQMTELRSERLVDIRVIDAETGREVLSQASNSGAFVFCTSVDSFSKLVGSATKFKIRLRLTSASVSATDIDGREDLICTIGKTSNQTLAEQILWTGKQAVLNTIKYCVFDVLLTFALERKFQTLFDLFPRKFNRQTFHGLIFSPPGAKSSNLLLYSLYGKRCLFKSTGTRAMHLFLDALKIECVPRSDDIQVVSTTHKIHSVDC